MTVVHDAHNITLHHGDSLDVLKTLPDESVDAIITDPPYALRDLPGQLITETLTRWVTGDRAYTPRGKGFMGNDWDEFVPPPALWDECFRVLKPGGHLAAFAGSRTQDLMGMAVRLAGFEIRDGLAWLYSQGFPKSLRVDVAIDKTLGTERPVVGHTDPHDPRTAMARSVFGTTMQEGPGQGVPITTSGSAEAARWEGWGTGLKPAHEPIILARKPLVGTVANNVLEHGTGAINVDGCRVEHANEADRAESEGKNKHHQYGTAPGQNNVYGDYSMVPRVDYDGSKGRWPTNVLISHHPGCDEQDGCATGCPAAEVDSQSGQSTSRAGKPRSGKSGEAKGGSGWGISSGGTEYNDTGGASRFFPTFQYEAKAKSGVGRPVGIDPDTGELIRHDTVKPVDLMRWLIRLLTPPGGLVLDPFAGSGTTGEACLHEGGLRCVLVERNEKYLPLIVQRVNRLRDPVAWVAQVGPADEGAGGATLFDVLADDPVVDPVVEGAPTGAA